MATSSITKNFVITGKDRVKKFVELLYSEPVPIEPSHSRMITDPEELNALFEAWQKNTERRKQQRNEQKN